MSGSWRPMRADDLAAVVVISDAVHGEFAEPRAVYAERLALYPHGCRVCEVDGAVVGLLVTHPWHGSEVPKIGALIGALPDQADVYYFHDIALLPIMRRKGAGAAAMEIVLAQAQAAGCREVRLVAVNGADSYWAAQGFAYVAPDTDGPYGPGSFLMRRVVGA